MNFLTTTNEVDDTIPLWELYDACNETRLRVDTSDDLETILPSCEDILPQNKDVMLHTNVITNEIMHNMVKTFVRKNLDCPREGGCHINRIKCKGGSGKCKGKNAIGYRYNYVCVCGLHWKENNWMERERKKRMQNHDIRCVVIYEKCKSIKTKKSHMS